MKNTEVRIGFVLPSLAHGGAQKVFVELYSFLQSQDRNVCLACLDQQGELLHRMKSKADVEYFYSRDTAAGIWVRAGQLFQLKRWVRKNDVQILYSTLTGMNLFVLMSFLFDRSIKIVVREAASLENVSHPIKLFAMRLLYRRADKIICTSEYVKQQLLKRRVSEKNRMVFIPNPVDMQRVLRMSKVMTGSLELSMPRRKHVISVGRLIIAKGMDVLIAAISRHSLRNRVRLTIIGDGPEREHLMRMVEDLQLQDTVHFLGYQENPYPYMREADLYVMASRWEGYVNTLVEAMVLKLQIVATDCHSGPGELLKSHLDMKLVEPGNSELLGEAIEKALDEMTVPDYKPLLQLHSMDKVAQSYLSVL